MLYHTHCAFNQLAEMESAKNRVRERLSSSSPLLSRRPSKAFENCGMGNFYVHWPVTYPLFIICCEILLEQISLAFPKGYHSPTQDLFSNDEKESLHQNILLPSVVQL